MAEHIRFNLGNIAVISFIAILALGIAVWGLRFVSNTNIPVVSHLAVGGRTFIGGM